MSLKKVSIFAFSNYIALFSALLQGLLTAKLLSTADMGSFSQIRILVSYLLLINPGVINGLVYLIPLSKEDEGRKYGSSSFVFALILFSVVFAFLTAIFLKTRDIQLLFIGSILVFTSLKEVLSFTLRGFQKFNRVSVLNMASSVLQAFLVIVFSYYWRLAGALWALLISSAASLAIGLILSKGYLSLSFSFEKIRQLFSRGWMIYLNGVYAMILSNFERLSLSFATEKSIFAVYSVGMFFISIFDMLSSSIAQFITPMMIKDEKTYTEDVLRKTADSMLYVMVIFIFPSLLILKFTVLVFLESYTESARIASVLSVTSLFQVYYNLMFAKFVSSNTVKKNFPLQTIGSVLTVLGVILYFMFFDSNDLIMFSLYILSLRLLYFIFSVAYFRLSSHIQIIDAHSAVSLLTGLLLFSSTYFAGRFVMIASSLLFLIYATLYYGNVKKWKNALM